MPVPRGTTAVSDWTSRTCSIGMPSSSCTIIANAVSWPWPCDDVPTVTSTPPSAAISTLPYSWNRPAAVTSTYDETPMPSSLRVAALATGPLLGAQLVVAGDAARFVERLRVLADVVVRAGDRGERERVGRR